MSGSSAHQPQKPQLHWRQVTAKQFVKSANTVPHPCRGQRRFRMFSSTCRRCCCTACSTLPLKTASSTRSALIVWSNTACCASYVCTATISFPTVRNRWMTSTRQRAISANPKQLISGGDPSCGWGQSGHTICDCWRTNWPRHCGSHWSTTQLPKQSRQ